MSRLFGTGFIGESHRGVLKIHQLFLLPLANKQHVSVLTSIITANRGVCDFCETQSKSYLHIGQNREGLLFNTPFY